MFDMRKQLNLNGNQQFTQPKIFKQAKFLGINKKSNFTKSKEKEFEEYVNNLAKIKKFEEEKNNNKDKLKI